MTPEEHARKAHDRIISGYFGAGLEDVVKVIRDEVFAAVMNEREQAAKRCEHYGEDVRHGLGIGQTEEVITLLEKASEGCAYWVRNLGGEIREPDSKSAQDVAKDVK